MGKLNYGRRYHTATRLSNGRVLAVGGVDHDLYSGGYRHLDSTELFDPAQFVWIVTDNLAIGRSGNTQTVMHDGRVLVAGGDNAAEYSNTLTSAEIYEPGTSGVIFPPDHYDGGVILD